MESGSKFQLAASIAHAKEELNSKLFGLEENGQTALGLV